MILHCNRNPGYMYECCVSLCVCLSVCGSSTALTVESIFMKLCTNDLTDICQWRFFSIFESFIEIGSVVSPYQRGHTDTQTDRQTHRHTDRQPGIFRPNRSQYIQSMKMTECNKNVKILKLNSVILVFYIVHFKPNERSKYTKYLIGLIWKTKIYVKSHLSKVLHHFRFWRPFWTFNKKRHLTGSLAIIEQNMIIFMFKW